MTRFRPLPPLPLNTIHLGRSRYLTLIHPNVIVPTSRYRRGRACLVARSVGTATSRWGSSAISSPTESAERARSLAPAKTSGEMMLTHGCIKFVGERGCSAILLAAKGLKGVVAPTRAKTRSLTLSARATTILFYSQHSIDGTRGQEARCRYHPPAVLIVYFVARVV